MPLTFLHTCTAASLHRHKVFTADVLESTGPCLEFLKYVPSSWESEWIRNAKALQSNICGKMGEQRELGREWLSNLAADSRDIQQPPDHKVLSSYQYRNVCSDSGTPVHFPIEPTVGLLRHPFAYPCAREPESQQLQVDVQDRDYLLLAHPDYVSSFPGRRMLFDLGSGNSFSSSLQWFVERYQDHAVSWDEIWAWDIKEIEPQEYWQGVPDEVYGKLHFYNTYASDKHGPPSPLGILQDRFRPGDFVVIKLDIDHEVLEGKIMQQLLEIRYMVGEVFFEMHFDAPEMHEFFGGGHSNQLHSTLLFFEKYRKAGIRLHYWP